jgi:hypothetical protein
MPVTSQFSPGVARGVHELCTRCSGGGVIGGCSFESVWLEMLPVWISEMGNGII